MKKVFVSIVLSMAFIFQALPLFADTPASDIQAMKSMMENMQKQMAKMQETIAEQNLRIQQLESKKVLETPKPVTSLEPTDFKKKVTDAVGEVFPWLKGAKYGGDFRLRSEMFDYYDKNNDAGSTGTAADRSRNRFRIRLRWGFEKDYGDDWKVGFRLSTGSATDQTSPMQTLGNRGHFTFKDIFIDRAYAVYTPSSLKQQGLLKETKVGAGKFENPFLRYSTPIVWDPDVAPEGVYETASFELVNTENNKVSAQATTGQFVINEGTALESDAALYGYQGALSLSTYVFNTKEPVDLSLAASYYDYTNWFQTITTNSSGASFLRTNTLVADDFRVLDIYPELVFYIDRKPVTLWYNYAANLANVGTEDIAQSGGNDIHDMDEAWGAGLKFGKAKKKGDWEVFYAYYEIGANAVVAAFNDSDFGGPGQVGATNRIGHKFGLGYQLTDNIMANFTVSLVRPLNPSVLVASSTNEEVLRSQVDLNYKF